MSVSLAGFSGCAEFWIPTLLLVFGVAAGFTWYYTLLAVLLMSLLLLSNVFDVAKFQLKDHNSWKNSPMIGDR